MNGIILFLMIDGSSDIQSALPAGNIGFLNKLRMVLKTRSQIEGASSVNLEKCCVFLKFKKFLKKKIYHSLPLSFSILRGDLLDDVRIFGNSFFIVCEFLFFKGMVQKFFENLLILTKIYLKPPLFEIL